ncbi:enhanced serine sensitivity protein SseB C-terminal domain-containing protein [Bacillus tianshenii]|uniref:enhanced serine sensitivity protein SseB C-terminal domain-containing protein n=1 Tax=Sutcliffiella tianshenii TaxID=1463404 RepID=UPI001CD5CE29|nr:enhanced serine sensitivity protein SseB C-terminal domain-containing protein [Bacillus tianshenii]MCA1318360.1 enhanced serine sensitivity protein SseB C-terminal domain-containing protein [Bacillus tianshenii]
MKKTEYHDPFDPIMSKAIDDPASRYHFYKALLDQEVVVIGTLSNDEETLNLKYIEIEEELILPVFTSIDKFQAILESNYPYIQIPANMLLEMVETDIPWVLNPGFEPSKKMIREELETLKDGRILHYFFDQLPEKERESLLTEQMIDLPEQAMEVLCALLKGYNTIKKAYLTHLFHPSFAGQSFPLLALELHENNQEGTELVQTLYDVLNQQLQLPIKIELIVLDEISPLANSIVQHNKPFYMRETLNDLRSMFD